jgi:hypothetical protein
MATKVPVSLSLEEDTPYLARKLDFDSYDDVSHTTVSPHQDMAVVPLDFADQNRTTLSFLIQTIVIR